MKNSLRLGAALLAGFAMGAGAMQEVRAQATPPAYSIPAYSIVEVDVIDADTASRTLPSAMRRVWQPLAGPSSSVAAGW